ncbi:hypothetical protein [Proteus mirabilis]|uniref:hypothetical protein n=1 Tax=Proteus mirabilis TaxID=584 RepID=UPI000789D95D|nr:hypothetical protein [Proteus mirabilis]QQT49114.1 hypothetical protein I6I36_16180 [Proteus mirabilis]HCT3367369.1 hypothetical protein [Proteus mirabilis]
MDVKTGFKYNKSRDISGLFKKITEEKNKSLATSNEVNKTEKKINETYQQDDKARNTLTFHFLWGFFILIGGCFLFVLIYNFAAVRWLQSLTENGVPDAASHVKLLELDKVLAVVIGALGTSLGFIIGYYFKEKKS